MCMCVFNVKVLKLKGVLNMKTMLELSKVFSSPKLFNKSKHIHDHQKGKELFYNSNPSQYSTYLLCIYSKLKCGKCQVYTKTV